MRPVPARLAVFGIAAAITLGANGVAFGEIGVFAAANQDLTGTAPAQQPRPMYIQDKVVANERIASSTEGGGQILFLDQSSLTISPNSDIVLDQFVYNPDTQTGEMGLTVLKGAMRLVGGRITKTNPAIIRTPTATIGIRGGMGTAAVGDDGVTRYMHIAGISSTIESGDRTMTITREGGYAEIGPNGEIEYFGVAPPEFVAAAYSRQSTGAGTGGGTNDGDKTTQGTNQVERVVSGDGDATEQQPISTTGEQQSGEADTDTVETTETQASQETVEELADEIAGTIDQEIDSLFTLGTYTSIVTADFDNTGHSFSSTSTEQFAFFFSLDRNQGFVAFGLPDTGDDLSVDAETLADIQATGLETVLARTGSLSLLSETSLDGFLIEGFPFSSLGTTAPGGGVEAQVEVSTGPEELFVTHGSSGAVADLETFAGGEIEVVAFDIDQSRNLNGTFIVNYVGAPDFERLENVTGLVDIPLQERVGLAADINNATDNVRTLIELDSVGVSASESFSH